MSRRKIKKRSLIRVYAARVIALFIAITMLVLMFCGCLYIKEHLFQKDDKKQTQEENQVAEETPSNEDVETQAEIPEVQEPVDSTKYLGYAVMIDPGHGGNDGGTSSGDIIEKDINMAVSLKLAELLKAQGVEVFLTRDTDVYVSLEERVYKTNQTTADFFVSLHCNYFEEDSAIDGFETFYCVNSEADIYAENIAAAAEATNNIAVRGAKENNYYVTRKVAMDSILIEMGFLSNPAECSKLSSDAYQDVLAHAIADGIFATFDAKEGNNA